LDNINDLDEEYRQGVEKDNNLDNKVTTDLSLEMLTNKSITIHDVYYYLKGLPFIQLRQIYNDRMISISNGTNNPHINKQCIYTLTQCELMFHT